MQRLIAALNGGSPGPDMRARRNLEAPSASSHSSADKLLISLSEHRTLHESGSVRLLPSATATVNTDRDDVLTGCTSKTTKAPNDTTSPQRLLRRPGLNISLNQHLRGYVCTILIVTTTDLKRCCHVTSSFSRRRRSILPDS